MNGLKTCASFFKSGVLSILLGASRMIYMRRKILLGGNFCNFGECNVIFHPAKST